MLKTKLTRTALACLLVVVLMLSLFSISAFAEDADTTEDTTANDTVDTTEDATTGTTDDGHDHDHEETEEKTEEKKGLTTGDIISLSVLGVLIIAVVIYCLTHKEKVGKFFRSIKSEYKKISWTPWTQLRKNTIVVLIVVIAVALVIGVADYVFQLGLNALRQIF